MIDYARLGSALRRERMRQGLTLREVADRLGTESLQCEDYIECSMEVTPEAIASIIATYGPEGSCWALPGVTPEDCGTECAAKMADLADVDREAAGCWACDVAADCRDRALRCEQWGHTRVSPEGIGHCDELDSSSTC